MIYIGIPTINLADHLARTVGSIQCLDDHKIIVVNNNPYDEEFMNWAECVNHHIIINEQNRGVAGSWNQILKYAMQDKDVEAIFILNDDIILHPNCINKMLESMRLENYWAISAAMVRGPLERMQNFDESMVDSRYNITGMHFSCFGLIPEVITQVGMFDEGYKLSYVEDTDYFYRIEQAKIKKGCDKYAWFTHYRVRERYVGDRKASHRQNRKYFYNKWKIRPKDVARRMMGGTRI